MITKWIVDEKLDQYLSSTIWIVMGHVVIGVVANQVTYVQFHSKKASSSNMNDASLIITFK